MDAKDDKELIPSNIVTIENYYYDSRVQLSKGTFNLFKGHRITDGKPVAVRKLNKFSTEECHRLTPVGNQNVLLLLDVITTDAHTYLINEYCDFDLRVLLSKFEFGRFKLTDMQIVARHLAKGYMALHCAGIVHGRIKPENILVEITTKNRARLKLADFRRSHHRRAIMSPSGDCNDIDLEPEILQSSATDLLCMGAVLYECYTSDIYFPCESESESNVIDDLTYAAGRGETLNLFLNFKQMLTEMTEPVVDRRLTPVKFFSHSFHASVQNDVLLQMPEDTNVARNTSRKLSLVQLNGYYYSRWNVIGEGYFGKVYKGNKVYKNKAPLPVAIKKIHLEKVEENEWKIPTIVQHPHILQLIDRFFIESKMFIITELCDCDLRLLLRVKRFSLEEIRIISSQLSKGYMALHSAGVVHGDIKPANILVKICKLGITLKLADFGCGKLDESTNAPPVRRRLLTYDYQSREIVDSGQPDARSDIWSLGLVMYEIAYGERFKTDFRSGNYEKQIADVQRATIRDGHLDDMLAGMLRRSCKHRLKPCEFFEHPFHASVFHGTYLEVDNTFAVDDNWYDFEDNDIFMSTSYKIILKLFQWFWQNNCSKR